MTTHTIEILSQLKQHDKRYQRARDMLLYIHQYMKTHPYKLPPSQPEVCDALGLVSYNQVWRTASLLRDMGVLEADMPNQARNLFPTELGKQVIALLEEGCPPNEAIA